MGKKSRVSDQVKGKREGKDEMNLAVFPISALARVKEGTKSLEFGDIIRGEGGKPIKRTWRVQGGAETGLPTSFDDNLMIACLELSKEQGFDNERIYFSRRDLAHRMGIQPSGKMLDRIVESFERLAAVRIHAKNAFYREGKYVSIMFGLIDKVVYMQAPDGGSYSGYFIWSEVMRESFRAGYLKSLDTGLYFRLKNQTARRLLRYLDKQFGRGHTFKIDICKIAYEHIGISRVNKYISQLVQQLGPALDELQQEGYLESWEVKGRILHLKRVEKKEYEQEMPEGSTEEQLPLIFDSNVDREREASIYDALTDRGISSKQAAKLVSSASPVDLLRMAETIAYFDFLVKRNRGRIENPPGFLVSLIRDGIAMPRHSKITEEIGQFGAGMPTVDRLGQLEADYINFLDGAIDEVIANIGEEDFNGRVRQKQEELLASEHSGTFKKWPQELFDQHASLLVRNQIAAEVGLPDFETWLASQEN